MEEYDEHADKHCAPDYENAKVWQREDRLHAWVITGAARLSAPIPFSQASGGNLLTFHPVPEIEETEEEIQEVEQALIWVVGEQQALLQE